MTAYLSPTMISAYVEDHVPQAEESHFITDYLPSELWVDIMSHCPLNDVISLITCNSRLRAIFLTNSCLNHYCGNKWDSPCYGRKPLRKRTHPDAEVQDYCTICLFDSNEIHRERITVIKNTEELYDANSPLGISALHTSVPIPLPDLERIPLTLVFQRKRALISSPDDCTRIGFALVVDSNIVLNGYGWTFITLPLIGSVTLFGEYFNGQEQGMWVSAERVGDQPKAEVTLLNGKANGPWRAIIDNMPYTGIFKNS